MGKGVAIALLCAVLPGTVGAATTTGSYTNGFVAVTNPYLQLFNIGPSDLFGPAASLIRAGADAITPDGNFGTTAKLVNAATGVDFSTNNLTFVGSLAVPHEFTRTYSDLDSRRGNVNWNMVVTTAGGASWTVASGPAGGAQTPVVFNLPSRDTLPQLGLINNFTATGGANSVVLAWQPPTNGSVQGYRIGIIDRESYVPNGTSGLVFSQNYRLSAFANPSFPSLAINCTAPAANCVSFQPLPNHRYVIQVSALQTWNGSLTDLSNSNTQALSRKYIDWTPSESNSNLILQLPTRQPDGSFAYDFTVIPNTTYYIDPEVATGYVYQTGAGNPNIRSVTFPTGIGDGLFDIFIRNSLGTETLVARDWLAGTPYDFGPSGVDWFKVTGIEASAGLDPANATAFVTALTFTGAGAFTGTQTPITTLAEVPAPGGLGLLGLALAGLLASARCGPRPTPSPGGRQASA